MDKFAIWSYMEVKPGKEQEVEAFLKHAHALIAQESGTTTFYTLQIEPSKYATFNTFADESALNAHVNGPVAKELLAKSDELFVPATDCQDGNSRGKSIECSNYLCLILHVN